MTLFPLKQNQLIPAGDPQAKKINLNLHQFLFSKPVKVQVIVDN